MMTDAAAIFFGVEVPEALLAAEMQNHEASSLADARAMAGRALATKAVLLARAEAMGIDAVAETNADGQEETAEEARIRALLSSEIDVDPPEIERLKSIYDGHPDAFLTPPLIEASHILIAPMDASEAALEKAQATAANMIADLALAPERFERMAANHSDCPSGADRGTLGQLRPGDVLAEIWQCLETLSVGEIATQPIRTEHGWHVLRLDARADSERLPFDYVRPHISAQIEAREWTRAAGEFVDKLLKKSADKPGLRLNESGGLASGAGAASKATNLLGHALGDIPGALAALSEDARAAVQAAASSRDESDAQILKSAISDFLSGADDDAWTKIISRLREREDALSECLDVIVAISIPPVKARHTLILQPGGRGAVSSVKGQSHGIGK